MVISFEIPSIFRICEASTIKSDVVIDMKLSIAPRLYSESTQSEQYCSQIAAVKHLLGCQAVKLCYQALAVGHTFATGVGVARRGEFTWLDISAASSPFRVFF